SSCGKQSLVLIFSVSARLNRHKQAKLIMNKSGEETMRERIVMLGGGAVGGYVGGHLALHGHDVTLIDFWHDNVEAIRNNGLELSGMTEEERQVSHPQTMHMHEVA